MVGVRWAHKQKMTMDDKSNRVDELIQQGRNVLNVNDPIAAHQAFQEWDQQVAAWLDETHPCSGISGTWSSISVSSLVMGKGYFRSQNAWVAFRQAVVDRLAWLARLAQAQTYQREGIAVSDSALILSKKVFVVHGRNETYREAVARLLEKLELQPIILHELANKGRTIIEKFLDHSDVSFAVVLLTADDRGGLASDPPDSYLPRARQNVLLELGFFLGKLGRDRVCALYQGNVEIPSDYQGVLFIKLDEDNSWMLRLAKEIKSSGIPVDLNRL